MQFLRKALISMAKKGDANWEQIALCEGWANYIEWVMPYKYLSRKLFDVIYKTVTYDEVFKLSN